MNRLVRIAVFTMVAMVLVGAVYAGGAQEAAKPVRLVGATQLPPEYVFHRTLEHFSAKVKEYYRAPIEIQLHHSGDLGQEKDFIEFMIQGTAVDFAIAAPSWAATFDQRVSFLDPPFLFRSIEHWEKVLAGTAFKPIQDDLMKKGLRILGFGGGGTRNLILRRPVANMAEASTVQLRVMASPIQARVFGAVGVKPTPIAYGETYNAIKTGVVDGLENESAAIMAMRFYEVAPNIVLTRHAITVRPLFFSERSMQRLSKPLQDAIIKAGIEATAWHRATEVREDAEALKKMEAEGKIKLIPFDTAEMLRRARPVLEAFAKELGAEEILRNVDAVR